MFIRKRVKKLKNGTESVTYQAVKSYRQDGKIRQDVIGLGKSSNIKDVLGDELRFLERMRSNLEIPISEYKEIRERRGMLVMMYLPQKEAQKRRDKLLKQYKEKGKRVAKLESLSSRLQ